MSNIERCSECGFDGSSWTDRAAIAEIRVLGERWAEATASLSQDAARRRPIENMWSIGEYVDHVREVLFGMRFVLGMAVEQPGSDLGSSPENEFSDSPKEIDLLHVLSMLTEEAELLAAALDELSSESWTAVAVFDDEDHDAHWICRHAVHDATHHLRDVERIKNHVSLHGTWNAVSDC